jgi:hypothetical protein
VNDNSCAFSNHLVSPVSVSYKHVCVCTAAWLYIHTHLLSRPIPSLNYIVLVWCHVPMLCGWKNASVILTFPLHEVVCQRGWIIVWQSYWLNIIYVMVERASSEVCWLLNMRFTFFK